MKEKKMSIGQEIFIHIIWAICGFVVGFLLTALPGIILWYKFLR